MKNYYITATIAENMPDYDFIIKAKDIDQAYLIAFDQLAVDYPDIDWGGRDDNDAYNFSLEEITAEQLLAKLTLN